MRIDELPDFCSKGQDWKVAGISFLVIYITDLFASLAFVCSGVARLFLVIGTNNFPQSVKIWRSTCLPSRIAI